MLTIDDQHRYVLSNKRFNNSVSQIVSKYCPPFPKETIAEAIAKRDGGLAGDIMAKWDLNAKISTEFGQAIHKSIEYWIRYGEKPKHPYLAQVVEKWTLAFVTTGPVRPEIAVYSEGLSLCGTMDILEITGPRKAKIHDIKTNADLYKDGKKMLKPFQNLDATPYNKYRLQLSLYKHLMELKGWEIEGICLWHWQEEWTEIKLEPLEVKNIL